MIRSYADREALEAEQAAFWDSHDWRSGPRSELMDRIETYVNTLLRVPSAAVAGMKALNEPKGALDFMPHG